jgi:alkylation response protein AidB-like acyl-CoA dehydrogenase
VTMPVVTTGPVEVPTVEQFVDGARAFLDARYRLKTRGPTKAFVWGDGSDRVSVFEEPDPDLERERVQQVREWRTELFEHGYAWIDGPTEYGGSGLPSSHRRAFDALVRRYDVAGNGLLTIGLGMIAPTILAHGTPGAKARYLAPLQRGDLIACQLFSEPSAGSDLASVSTRAIRDGDGWRVTGQKVWTSGAQFSDIGEVLCRTSDGPRHRNLSAFVVDMHADGVEVRPLRQMTGGSAFNEVFLEDVWIPDDDLLAEAGEGWRVAITTLSNERNAIGGEGFGGAGLLDMDRYRQMLRHFGRSDDPVARQRFAQLYTETRVAKFSRQRASDAARAGRPPGAEASLGKLALSENMTRIAAFVADVLGPTLLADVGEWGTYAWSQFVLGTPGYRLGGGTDEILKTMIGERVLGLPKEPT